MPVEDDKLRIRELIEAWVVWRDMGEWARLREIWHEDGMMAASWREGTADQFVDANRASFDKGLDILHQLGGSWISVQGDRAISITKMVISQRAAVEGVLCDVSAQSRHFDLWEKRAGRWGLLERKTIFDRDRIDPVVPGEVVKLDEAILGKFPTNYKHLAYLQSASLGFPVRADLPHLRSQEAAELFRYGERFLQDGTRG